MLAIQTLWNLRGFEGLDADIYLMNLFELCFLFKVLLVNSNHNQEELLLIAVAEEVYYDPMSGTFWWQRSFSISAGTNLARM